MRDATPHVFGKSAQAAENRRVGVILDATVCDKSAQIQGNTGVMRLSVYAEADRRLPKARRKIGCLEISRDGSDGQRIGIGR